MLYHLPEPGRAVRELRRITRPGGRLIVSLNGQDHLRELRDVVAAALVTLGREPSSLLRERIALDRGEALLRTAFTSVTRHDFVGQLRVPSPEPVVAYVRSMRETARLPDARPLVEAVTRNGSRTVAGQGGEIVSVLDELPQSGEAGELELRGAGAWAPGLVQRGKDRL